jgi:hypothetical protein
MIFQDGVIQIVYHFFHVHFFFTFMGGDGGNQDYMLDVINPNGCQSMQCVARNMN